MRFIVHLCSDRIKTPPAANAVVICFIRSAGVGHRQSNGRDTAAYCGILLMLIIWHCKRRGYRLGNAWSGAPLKLVGRAVSSRDLVVHLQLLRVTELNGCFEALRTYLTC